MLPEVTDMTSNSRYSMLDSMDIRCTRCGYENNPQFRFCGMCGAALRPRDPEQREDLDARRQSEGEILSQRLVETAAPPEPMPVEPLIAELTAAQKHQTETVRTYARESRQESHSPEPFHPEPVHGERTPVPMTGLSFLGLSENADDRRVDYLLEDEPHSGRAGRLIGFLLLLAICAGGIFYWRKAGYPWPSHVTTATDSSTQPTTVTPSEVSPPMENRQIAEKPNTGVGDNPLPPVASDAGSSNAAASNAGAAATNDASAPAKASEESSHSTEASGSDASETKEAPENPEKAEADPSQPAEKPLPAQTAALAKPKPLKPAPVMSSAENPAEDSLFLQGQKYLYGSPGVPANCARAQQYLTTSATNNNPKAQSTLGTMYATGHCVGRNLPIAYRWFARALREDTRNTRLERDVQMMWDQMSPQERSLALKNE